MTKNLKREMQLLVEVQQMMDAQRQQGSSFKEACKQAVDRLDKFLDEYKDSISTKELLLFYALRNYSAMSISGNSIEDCQKQFMQEMKDADLEKLFIGSLP